MEVPSKDNSGFLSVQAIGRIGQSVNIAIERFATVGEKIADDNADIRPEMLEACKEARNAGTALETLCNDIATNVIQYPTLNGSPNIRNTMCRASKALLSSITRVLLLADIVVVKQLLLSKDKVSKSLDKLESVYNFTDFVNAFSIFGSEMIELAHLIGNRPNKLKEERRRAEIINARQILERSTVILLTSSKACLLHPECAITKENRDTVFCQIRRAMDLIHYVVKDGVIENLCYSIANPETSMNWISDRETLYFTLLNFCRLLNIYKQKSTSILQTFPCEGNFPNESEGGVNRDMGSYNREEYQSSGSRSMLKPPSYANNRNPNAKSRLSYSPEQYRSDNMDRLIKLNPVTKEMLLISMDNVIEKTEDFTDSAYINHETRENILLLCERCKLELNQCLRIAINLDSDILRSPNDVYKIDGALGNLLTAVKDLSDQLILSVSDQVFDLHHSLKMTLDILTTFRSHALNQELDHLYENISCFHDYFDHILDVCKLFQHVAATDSLQIQAKFSEINIRVYGPQVLNAARILSIYPSSKVAYDNFDAFFEMWRWLSTDVTYLCEQIISFTHKQKLSGHLEYLSLSSAWTNDETAKKSASPWMDNNEQQKIENSGLEIKRLSNQIEEQTDKWKGESDEDNDIVKRAKNMSSMAFLMYQFTKGDGALRTTQDLFTQAEYFAEEANRLYKVVRQFSYQVPAGKHKKELLEHIEKVPKYVQNLQFTVKDHTVGKDATFEKVDQVIRETKNLMKSVNKVTSVCFDCAKKNAILMTPMS